MTFTALVARVSDTTAIDEADVKLILRTAFKHIQYAILEGDKVVLTGFGKFSPRRLRAGRKAIGSSETAEFDETRVYCAFRNSDRGISVLRAGKEKLLEHLQEVRRGRLNQLSNMSRLWG